MICVACNQYAASKDDLCGNCSILSSEDLKLAIKSREARAELDSRKADAGSFVAKLQQQIEQLTAENDDLKKRLINQLAAENNSLKKPTDEPMAPPAPSSKKTEPVFRN